MQSSVTELPAYWLPQPPIYLDEPLRRLCDRLWDEAIAHHARYGLAWPIAYTLPIPKWQFLCYLVETHNLALHGSGEADIDRFEPRQSSDLEEFGAQRAVYAASDGIWPIYFAIVNRSHSPTLINACIKIEQPDGSLGGSYYFFSISRRALDQQPYRTGTLYLLPRTTFINQPPIEFGPLRIHTTQLASHAAVEPIAKLDVTPQDFPFLAQMRVHDDDRLAEYSQALQQGLPLPD